jgi:hypothetical protein
MRKEERKRRRGRRERGGGVGEKREGRVPIDSGEGRMRTIGQLLKWKKEEA